MSELERLLAKAHRLAAEGEALSLSFARELARVWRDAERHLARLAAEASGSVTDAAAAARAIVLQTQVRRVLETAGYDRLVAASTASGVDRLVAASFTATEAAGLAALTAGSSNTIEALRRIAATDLFAQGDEVAHALWRSLVQDVFTARPIVDIVQDLADALDAMDVRVRTLFDTQMSIFTRQVERLQTDDLGDQQPYLYAGPIDDITREWCLERVGKVYTRAEIDAMDNGQLPNCFLTAGGFRCRHIFQAVESEELRALAGTGERVSGYEDDITRIRERQAAKKAAKLAKRKKAA